MVSGDLSQSLGSPVERGQILFEVAPLKAYHLILKVNEEDIGHLKTSQQGSLALASMPQKLLPFTIKKITPVSTAENGHNSFRVEAGMEMKSDLLRPGMEGIAKIEINRRKLLWIWTHGFFDWLKMSLWTWRP